MNPAAPGGEGEGQHCKALGAGSAQAKSCCADSAAGLTRQSQARPLCSLLQP